MYIIYIHIPVLGNIGTPNLSWLCFKFELLVCRMRRQVQDACAARFSNFLRVALLQPLGQKQSSKGFPSSSWECSSFFSLAWHVPLWRLDHAPVNVPGVAHRLRSGGVQEQSAQDHHTRICFPSPGLGPHFEIPATNSEHARFAGFGLGLKLWLVVERLAVFLRRGLGLHACGRPAQARPFPYKLPI